MTDAELRDMVVHTLARIAPEVAGQPLDHAAALRDQLDLDSMDLLNFVIALHETLQVEIPEADYGRLATLDAIVAYLADRLGGERRA